MVTRTESIKRSRVPTIISDDAESKEQRKCRRDWLNRSITKAVLQSDELDSAPSESISSPLLGNSLKVSQWCGKVNLPLPSMSIAIEVADGPHQTESSSSAPYKSTNIQAFCGEGTVTMLF